MACLATIVAAGCAPQTPKVPETPGSPETSQGPTTAERPLLGTAVSSQGMGDPTYLEWIAAHADSLTPDVQMKMAAVQPSEGVFDFGPADAVVNLAEQNHQQVRGHTLLWHGGLPTWMPPSNELSCERARSILQNHITTLVAHYRGRVAEWDVANEVLDDGGGLRQDNPFLAACGVGLIADTFRWAHEADPGARLYLNDYDTHGLGPKSEGQFALVSALVDEGVPITGVGFQSHETLDGLAEGSAENLARYAALGLDIEITEADVRMEIPNGQPSQAQLDQQAAVYRSLVTLCQDQPRCTSFTLWGFTDRYSWVPEVLPGWGAASVTDEDYRARPAWEAVAPIARR